MNYNAVCLESPGQIDANSRLVKLLGGNLSVINVQKFITESLKAGDGLPFGALLPGDVSPLDLKRIAELLSLPFLPPCRSAFSRYFDACNILNGETYDINCKSWRCERHRYAWGRKWGAIIGEQLETRPCTLLVNLTTAEMITHVDLSNALRYFIKRFRAKYGCTEYVKVVEYNKRHTQPHFHLLFCCADLKIPPKTKAFLDKERLWNEERERQGKKPGSLSWPEDIFEFTKTTWGEALATYCPDKQPTTVVWCNPPEGNGQKAAKYAIGYITGANGADKNEEPNDTWRGRKLSYSKGFFTTRASDLWAGLIKRWFPEGQQVRFTWRLKPEARENYPREYWLPFTHMAIVQDREYEARFFREFGRLPAPGERWPRMPDVFEEIDDNGQGYFDTA